MNVISLDNKVLDASVSLQTIDDVYGLVLESRGGAKGKPNQRNIDYLPALDTILHRLSNFGVASIRIHVASSRAIEAWNPEDRVLKIDGKTEISLIAIDPVDVRKKISKAQQEKKENSTSKGGNPTKRIILEANISSSLWSDVVTGSSEADILISETDVVTAVAKFSPDETETEKEKVSRSVALRRGQPSFRKKLLKAYQNTCAITGTSFPPILEAAHIIPYMGQRTNHITNGLILRADIHTLFDLGLLGIDQNYTVVISSSLQHTEYDEYNGKKIHLPRLITERPSLEALNTRALPNRN